MSTISSISLNPNYYANTQNNFKQFKQDFADLAGSLQSGDLAGAQKTFSQLTQLQSNVPTANGQQAGNSGNSISADFSALGNALQSGDVSSAQQAFAKLQQDLQARGHGHHHHHSQATSGTQSQSTDGTALAPTSSDNDGDNDGSVSSALAGINVTA